MRRPYIDAIASWGRDDSRDRVVTVWDAPDRVAIVWNATIWGIVS